MTNKLKKKLKVKMTLAFAVTCILALCCVGYSLFVMGKDKQSALFLQGAESSSAYAGTVVSGTTVTCESLIKGVRDTNLPNGTYTFVVNGAYQDGANQVSEAKSYTVELINEYNDVTYAADISLGDTTTEKKMLIVKYHKNLTINPGVTVTASTVSSLTYKKRNVFMRNGDINKWWNNLNDSTWNSKRTRRKCIPMEK